MTTISPGSGAAGADSTVPVVLTPRRPDALRRAPFAEWSDRWVCVGFAEQLHEPGEILPATVGIHAVHVEKTRTGELRAGFNTRPFGGCMVIPVQCAGAHKIRCPNAACSFSEDPSVLTDENDPDRRLRRLFSGDGQRQGPEVPLAAWGSLLFVHVGHPSVLTPLPGAEDLLGRGLSRAQAAEDLAAMRPAAFIEEEHRVEWRRGPESLAASASARGMSAHTFGPHGVLVEGEGFLAAVLFRPAARGRSTLLGGLLLPPQYGADEQRIIRAEASLRDLLAAR